MSQAVLCPQCEKRYSLPDNPPATFTCKQCGALMDLTAFGGGQPAAAPPAPPAASPPATSPPTTSPPTTTPPTRSGGRRRRRRRAQGPLPQERRAQRESKAPVIGIITVVLIVVVLIAVRSGGDDSPKKSPPPRKKTALRDYIPPPPIDPDRSLGGDAGARKKRTKRPPLRADGSLKLRLSRIDLKVHEWPDEVSEETRKRVEKSLALMYAGGADGSEAREWLVEQGPPIAGRIISEFYTIQQSPGWDNRDGTSMNMQIDDLLRDLDGFMERTCREREQIRSTGVFAGISFMTRIAKRWTWWWESGEWKTNRQKPWDPFEDESDDSATGMKPLETPEKDKKKKGGGFGKRAGSG